MKGIKVTQRHVGRRVVIVEGLYKGISGTLAFYMYNLNGTNYVEVKVSNHGDRYIVPVDYVELCEESAVAS